ncbi:MAG: phosphoglucosamine mutase [archaeon]
MTGLFSTTGIRGIANRDFTPEFVLGLGKAFGTFLKGGKVLVARDTRSSSEALKNAFVSGLLSTGTDVEDAGVAPIPSVSFAVKQNYTAGAMITASHNPPEWNGLKFIMGSSLEIAEKEEVEFEKIFNSKKFLLAPNGSAGTSKNCNILEPYARALTNNINANAIRAKRFKVVVDTGNGAQSLFIPDFLESLGCEVIALHTSIGAFERPPEPTPETLTTFLDVVKQEKPDFGVAFDTDGDRAIFATGQGEFIMGDVTGTLLAHNFFINSKGCKVVTPIATSKAIDDVADELGGKVVKTKVGGKYIGESVMKSKAAYGFEENGGSIFPEISFMRDGSATVAKLLDLLASTGKFLEQLISEVPKYYQLKTKMNCSPETKGSVMANVLKKLEVSGAELITMDGIKAIYEDGSVMVRASGTEPVIRVFAEAKTKARAKELLDLGVSAASG